jgi:cytidylate kinase
MPEHDIEAMAAAMAEAGDSPLHGYRGEFQAPGAGGPAGFTIAISREAGSRGTSIATRAGEKLGWEVYTQDMMDFVLQDVAVRKSLLEKLPATTAAWIEQELDRLPQSKTLSVNPTLRDLARLVLLLGARGNVVLLGRGAGFLLPRRSTLHVRLVAPLEDRIAYFSQWMRLTNEEAADQVLKRDQRRAEFVSSHFHRKTSDVQAYDMVLNTSLLGEEHCADLIVAAAKAKMSAIVGMD